MSAKKIVIDARIRRSSTGRYVDRLIEHLQNIDYTNTYVVLLQPNDNWQPRMANFTVVACPFPQFTLTPFNELKFASFLNKLHADLVHFPMVQQPLFYRGRVVTSILDLTLLEYPRVGDSGQIKHSVKMNAYKLLIKSAVQKSSYIITISNFVKNELVRLYPAAKKVTNTYCAAEPKLSATAEQIANIKQPFIMHAGSPFPHKNINRLVKAFELLNVQHPNLQLVLAGKREYYFEQLEKVIHSSPISNKIIITGFVSDGELRWLYENTVCYVLPSLSEGFGLPGLEAMQNGTPLVSSNATCLPEVYGNAALYFDPLDVKDMASKINDVLTDKKLRADLIKKGYEQAKKYSWERMAKQTLEVYNKALND